MTYGEINKGKFPVPIGRHTTQAPYRPDELDGIVSGLRRLHPTFRRVLVGCDGTSRTQASASPALQRAAVAAGFDGVQCSRERDEDLLFMSTRCAVLVAGRSTFSLVAMLFAGDDSAEVRRVLYAPRTFAMSAMVGLFTPLDLSGVRQVEELMNTTRFAGGLLTRHVGNVRSGQETESHASSRGREHALTTHPERRTRDTPALEVFGPFTEQAP